MPGQTQSRAQTQRTAFPYGRRRYLLSIAERRFFEALIKAAPSGISIFCKVRLADLAFVQKGSQNEKKHFNRIQAKHIDFVLCDLRSSAVRLVIELDDKSHDCPKRQERDAFVDGVLSHVGIAMLRVRARSKYDTVALSAKLRAILASRRQ